MELRPIKEIKPNPDNPRVIRDKKFEKLKKSIQDFPEMLKLRPIVVDENDVILGGNMRYRALKELGHKYINVIKASELTEAQKREFVIKDNVGFGEWEWDLLANEWDTEELEAWGLDIPGFDSVDEMDLFDIELPFYQPSKVLPNETELADTFKTEELLKKIEKLKAPDALKEILRIRAAFFTDFNFDKIADYYYNSSDEVKEVMQRLGMVIIAPKDAVNLGFAEMQNEVFDL